MQYGIILLLIAMGILQSVLIKLGLADLSAQRNPITIFVLDDDPRRHRWFKKRFQSDEVEVAETVEEARKMLESRPYDAIFLDHDLLPDHYDSEKWDDENTGYAIAVWLSNNRKIQSAATVIVHTRNSEGGMRMVEIMRENQRTVEYVPYPLLDMKIRHYWQR